ncbi:ArsR/SmtB family transcription factor [Fretibacter rubidus]|uniref:ArsR/SmtB family transcription factor n=1 Tax=Fretibacter rubidus TaxID=570162 RepID=UPI00352B6D75
MDRIANALKVLGHPERLRILALLARGELTVSELTQILGLSQPRVTQYINSLESAAIIERLKEGSWVFSRLRRGNAAVTALVATTLNALPVDDKTLLSDRRRLEDVRAERAKAAESFFASVANDTGQLGDEYLPQSDIETAMRAMAGDGPFDYMVDLGTGTGRVLDVFSDRIARGSGIDNNTDMLKVARHKLASAGHDHISVRQGDLHVTPLDANCADLVTLHQVLHYLDDPYEAISEAARILSPGGRLLIIDFEAHDLEAFRKDYAHRRLGFQDTDIAGWAREVGLTVETVKTIKGVSHGRPNVKIWCAVKSAPLNKGHHHVSA